MAQIPVRGAGMPIRPQGGFSLIELMVAMAISLLLLAGVIAIFSSSRSSYETTEKMSRIQESGRYALDQFTHDIRSAGYVGCSRATTYISSSLKNPTNKVTYDFLNGPVRGYQYASAAWVPALTDGIPVPTNTNGSDILLLRIPARDAVPLKLTADMATGADPMTVENVAGAFKAGDLALAYSCEAEAYFQVTSYGGGKLEHAVGVGTPGNAVPTLSYAFRTNAEVVPVNTVVYYVDESVNYKGTVPVTTSLFRKTGDDVPEELVEGVEQMQIDYGIDTNNDDVVDKYGEADDVTDWSRVFSVRVAMLVRSMEQYGTDKDNRLYTLLTGDDAVGVPAPNDRHFREVFTATVSIRNKVVIN